MQYELKVKNESAKIKFNKKTKNEKYKILNTKEEKPRAERLFYFISMKINILLEMMNYSISCTALNTSTGSIRTIFLPKLLNHQTNCEVKGTTALT